MTVAPSLVDPTITSVRFRYLRQNDSGSWEDSWDTADELTEPNKLKIRTVLNGEVMQDWNTDDMIFDVPTLIEFLSGSTTLLPGTVILTGTPHGVGMARRPPVWLRDGDQVTIEIEKIGSLSNNVVDERV